MALPASGVEARQGSCVERLDELYFCYSPVYQLSKYYREGELDNCKGRWAALWGCMAAKAKGGSSGKDNVRTDPQPPRRVGSPSGMWEERTAEEAMRFWAEDFPHVAESSRSEKR